jgi:Protein of unknown function (DUF3102)
VPLTVRAERIRGYVNAARVCIIETGRELIAASEDVPSGQWAIWLKLEFGWKEQTARNYIKIAEAFPSLSLGGGAGIITITGEALTVLAAPDVPQAIRDEAIERAQTGEHITKGGNSVR